MQREPFKARGPAPRGERVRLHAIPLIALAALAAGDAPAQFSMNAQAIVSAGGTIRSAGGCYALAATVGEPAGGRIAGGAFAIDAGFQAGPGRVRGDQLFHGGFQECT